MVERLEMRTEDLSQEKIRRLGELFPNCITESRERDVLSVDFDALRQELSDHVVEGPKERYQFTWPDKSKARVLANTPTTMTLRPCREESVDFDNTKNLYIEGDNLEVLKILRKTYLGKVKMIYIDPPYNTGNDFVYKDNFSINSQDYIQTGGDFSNLGERLVLNTSSNGRFHTDWLNMMYPRLLLAKDFLSDDGVIFISIDDSEYSNLKKICDEIFGENRNIGTITWEKKTKPINSGLSRYQLQSKCEYILAYSKIEGHSFILRKKGQREYSYCDSGGHYRLKDIEDSDHGVKNRDTMKYPILGIQPGDGKRWKIGIKEANRLIETNKIVLLDGKVKVKVYPEDEDGLILDPFWSHFSTIVGTAESGKKELNTIMQANVGFDTVKPTGLIEELLTHFDNDILVLDFFGGSSTTAHAVLNMNNKDDGKRQFIIVQAPEICTDNSDLFQNGYSTICQLGKERIRRSGKEIRNRIGSDVVDVGFRVYKLDSSNMTNVFYDPSSFSQMNIEEFGNNIKPDRLPEDLLTQVMLDLRIELSAKIDTETIDGTPISIVDGGFLVACLSEECSESIITAVAKREVKPVYAVIRNGPGMTDQMLSNIEQIFKTYSPGTEVRYI